MFMLMEVQVKFRDLILNKNFEFLDKSFKQHDDIVELLIEQCLPDRT